MDAVTEFDAEDSGKATTSCKTFCRICVAFCGLEVISDGKRVMRVLPDKSNPYTWRDFCSKGSSSNKLRDHPKRLTTPMKRVGNEYVAVSYEQAIKEIAAQLNQIRNRAGANVIATYSGNPGMMNSTGSAFQGGFLAGLGSIKNYSAVSIDSSNLNLVAAEMYGCQMALLIPDVDYAKCLLFIGTNPAVSTMGWIDSVPDGWNRVLAAQAKGADLIVVDPRQTPTTKKANLHVAIRPGEDWAFLLGIIKLVFEHGWEHKQDCVEANGVDVLKAIAEQASLHELASRCAVPVKRIEDVARRFATAETAVCIARTGVAQNRNGTLGEWLSHVLNLITGRIDRKGGRVYSPGIFKNTMEFVNKRLPSIKRPSRIGGFNPIFGTYPMATLADEIMTPGDEQIRALIIYGGNPVVSGPDGAKLDAALQELELLIGIDFFQRESHRHAHWLIPACHFLEREDIIMVGAFFDQPFVQLGQAAVAPLAGIKPEWEFYRDLAVEMKVPFLNVRGLNGLIRASRWLARFTGNPRLSFNPRWLWALTIKASSCLKWKDVVSRPSGYFYAEKSYGHFRPQLQTKDGRIQAAPEMFIAVLNKRLAEPVPQTNTEYPFQLVNQRRVSMMNSWLVETVNHKEVYGDYIEINSADAAARQIQDKQEVTVRSRTASISARARISNAIPPGIVSMDHGWGSRLFDPVGAGAPEVQGVNRNLLIASGELDELSGMPNLNGTYVDLHPNPLGCPVAEAFASEKPVSGEVL